ncbi:MAG TPA: HNH endonuclease family protein [Cellulomonas sp.]
MPRVPVAVWVGVLVVGLATGLGVPWWTDARAAARYPVAADDLASARSALDVIAVRTPDPADGYTRERFGRAWADVDGNGCDTRNDMLARDLSDVRLGPDGCVVLAGTLVDPYSGTRIQFARGPDSAEVQIDHVVALDNAWRSGAQGWPAALRMTFANDPANLLAVGGQANQDKGASDAAQWLPPQAGYRCVYVVRQLRVKVAYGLWLTPEEHAAADRALRGCVVVR